jgi:hypothetical protein
VESSDRPDGLFDMGRKERLRDVRVAMVFSGNRAWRATTALPDLFPAVRGAVLAAASLAAAQLAYERQRLRLVDNALPAGGLMAWLPPAGCVTAMTSLSESWNLTKRQPRLLAPRRETVQSLRRNRHATNFGPVKSTFRRNVVHLHLDDTIRNIFSRSET